MKMTLLEKEIASGLRPAEYPDLSNEPWKSKPNSMRVKWVNKLRDIVARRMPKNKMGWPVVSDVDLLLATEDEREEALNWILKR